MVMMRWDPLYDEYYRPRGQRRKPPKPGRKRKKLHKRRPFPETPFFHDIDLMKLENLHGGFCACGSRFTEFCGRCFNEEM